VDRKIDQSKLITAVVILLLAVGAALLYWLYFLKPSFAKIGELQNEIATLEGEIDKLEDKLSKKDLIVQQWEEVREREPLLRSRIPGKEDLPQVLEALEKLVRRSPLELLTLNAGELTEGDRYWTVPVSLQVLGSRNELLLFLKELEKFNHMVLLGQSNIEKREGGHRLSVNFNLIFIPEGKAEEEVGVEEENGLEEKKA